MIALFDRACLDAEKRTGRTTTTTTLAAVRRQRQRRRHNKNDYIVFDADPFRTGLPGQRGHKLAQMLRARVCAKRVCGREARA